MNIEIANRLAALRKASALSQEQLADKLGISRQAISKWERAESSPDTDNLIALAKLYGVSLDELLKMDPEAEDDELFARLSAQPERADEPAEDDRAPDADKLWRFQQSDGSVDLRLFPFPIVVTLVYLLVGTFFDLWHPGWMLFLTVPVYYTALGSDGVFELNRIPYPLLITILYLVIGFAWDWWHPGWILFLTVPLYYTLAGRLMKTRVNQAIIGILLLGTLYMIGASIGHWFRFWLVGPTLLLFILAYLRRARKDQGE